MKLRRPTAPSLYWAAADHNFVADRFTPRGTLSLRDLASLLSANAIFADHLVIADTLLMYNKHLHTLLLGADEDHLGYDSLLADGFILPALRAVDSAHSFLDLERYLRETGTYRDIDDSRTKEFAQELDRRVIHAVDCSHDEFYTRYTKSWEDLLRDESALRSHKILTISRALRATLEGQRREFDDFIRRSFAYQFADSLSTTAGQRVRELADALYHHCYAQTVNLPPSVPPHLAKRVVGLVATPSSSSILSAATRSRQADRVAKKFPPVAYDLLSEIRRSREHRRFIKAAAAAESSGNDAALMNALEKYMPYVSDVLEPERAGRTRQRRKAQRHVRRTGRGITVVSVALTAAGAIPEYGLAFGPAAFAWVFVAAALERRSHELARTERRRSGGNDHSYVIHRESPQPD